MRPIPASVLLEDGRIAAVGPELPIPEGATVVDLAGLHLLPGLIDGFAYADPDHDLLYVAAGVLALCDHGNDLGRIFELREAATDRVAPAVYTAGAVLDGLPPATAEAVVLTSADDVDTNLPTLLAARPDFLAVHRNLGVEAWKRVLTLATRNGLAVWGPRPGAVTVDAFLTAGQRGLIGLEDLFLDQGADWTGFELSAAGPRIEAVAAAGLAIIPLQHVPARFGDLGSHERAEADVLRYLGPQYRARWSAELASRRALTMSDPSLLERELALLERRGALLASSAAAGVDLVAGSGAPNPWLQPGAGLHDELAAWRQVGVPADVCLRAATGGAAHVLDLHTERGAIATGLVADLIAVEADPREDLGVLRRPELVLLRGRVLRRAELDASLTQLATRQAAAARPREIDARPPKLPQGDVLLLGTATTSAVGARLSVERWGVVRELQGALVFAGRIVLPGAQEADDAVIHVEQRLQGRRLESFEVRWRARGHELVARGLMLAGSMRIERRANGRFIDNRTASGHIVALDIGSATTPILLGHAQGAGEFNVLRFHEGLEWEAVPWRLELDDDGRHAFSTPGGAKFALFGADGALRDLVEQRGSGFTRTFMSDVEVTGSGLALPEGKVAAAEEQSLVETPN